MFTGALFLIYRANAGIMSGGKSGCRGRTYAGAGVHLGRRGGDFISRGSPAGAGAAGDDGGAGGRGRVGLSTLPMAGLAGARTIPVDINDAWLALTGELGADELAGVGGRYGTGGAGQHNAGGLTECSRWGKWGRRLSPCAGASRWVGMCWRFRGGGQVSCSVRHLGTCSVSHCL